MKLLGLRLYHQVSLMTQWEVICTLTTNILWHLSWREHQHCISFCNICVGTAAWSWVQFLENFQFVSNIWNFVITLIVLVCFYFSYLSCAGEHPSVLKLLWFGWKGDFTCVQLYIYTPEKQNMVKVPQNFFFLRMIVCIYLKILLFTKQF